MKKIVLIGLLLAAGGLGFSYATAAWSRGQFAREVDSYMESARDLTESGLTPLLLNKAHRFGLELRPEDIRLRVEASDRDPTTSRLLESKGFKTEVRHLTLDIRYGQPFWGSTRMYTLHRERIFTFQAAPSTTTSPILPDENP
ncbi:MAG TPA: hypothetical protein VLY20_07815 [Nitrospiria bacterium]|nr:hypothetical protein [Nitrospiria bacterium]